MFILSPASASVAGKIEIKGLYSIEKEEFLDIFGVVEGETINSEKIRNGIKRVFLKNIFEDISVHVPDGESPVVIIAVRERDFINRIYISGSSQVSAKEIKKLLYFKEGSVMRYDLIEKVKYSLQSELSEYGFPDAEIDIRADKTQTSYRVNLFVDVDTGIPLTVKKIIIQGADNSIKDAFKTAEGDIYNQIILRKDLKRVKDIYKKEQYYSPVVGPYSYKDGELEVNVDPGKRLKLTITGNSAISEKALLKEVAFFEIEELNDELIGETADRMLSAYREKGYANAQVAPVQDTKEDEIEVTFFVFEGEKVKIEAIRFMGVKLPEQKLEVIMSSKTGGIYNPDSVERDKVAIKEFYGALGYLEAEVKAINVTINELTNTAEITVTVDEGQSTLISSLDIEGTDPEVKKELLSVIGIRVGDPYNEVDISDARFRILDYYNNQGYSHIEVTASRNIEQRNASIIFSISEGEKKSFGKTIIIGNKKTKYEVVKRELRHTEGQPYSFRMLAGDRHRLYKLGLFTEVDIEPVDTASDIKDIAIRVKEGNAGSVEFGFGYAEYERFRGFIELSYRNFWGMNRQGVLKAEFSSLERRYILQYHEPWFMGTHLPFRIFFMHENKRELNIDNKEVRYRLQRYTATAGVEKTLNNRLKADFYYEFSLVKTFDVQADVILSKEDAGTLAISSIKPSLTYDSRDNPFEPQKGILAGISLKIATPFLFSESNFQKLSLNASAYQRLSKGITLALSVRGGVAKGFGATDELPLVERFFLGGRSTVRGYEQDTLGPKGSDGNPTGGNAFFAGSVEFRTALSKSIGLVTFLDSGNVWIKSSDMDLADLKYTAGIGLRYKTPVGPLRVDFGYKLNRDSICIDKEKKDPVTGAVIIDPITGLPVITQRCTPGSPYAIHFSIGHAF